MLHDDGHFTVVKGQNDRFFLSKNGKEETHKALEADEKSKKVLKKHSTRHQGRMAQILRYSTTGFMITTANTNMCSAVRTPPPA